MTDPRERPDVATLSYEQARDELVQVVSSLENGTASLEDSLNLWERGEALADRCQSWLDSAKERLAAASADRAEGEADGGGAAGEGADSGGAPGGNNADDDGAAGTRSGADPEGSPGVAATPSGDEAQPPDDDGPPW